MKRKKVQYNEINDEIYTPEDLSKIKIIFLCFVLLLLGFLVNFNFPDRINAWLKPILANNQSCPIQYEKIEFELFMPKMIFKNPVIHGACFGQYYQKLPLKEINMAIHGPSFVPPGIKLKLSAKQGNTLINVIPSLSFGKKVIEIRDSKLDAKHMAVLFADGKSPFQGIISIDGVFHLEGSRLTEGKLDLNSRNLVMPEQNIKGFLAPTMNLKTLSLKARVSKDSNLDIREFKLGNGTPMGLMLRGRIFLNQENFGSSQVTLDGTLQTTPYFLESFALLKLLLPPDPNPSGLFKMKLKGELQRLGQPELTNP